MAWMDLTYVAKTCFTHLNYRAKNSDPFWINFMRDVDDVYSKIVSLFKIIFIIIHYNNFAISYKKNSYERIIRLEIHHLLMYLMKKMKYVFYASMMSMYK